MTRVCAKCSSQRHGHPWVTLLCSMAAVAALASGGATLAEAAFVPVARAQELPDPSATIEDVANPSEILLDDIRELMSTAIPYSPNGLDPNPQEVNARVVAIMEQADAQGNRDGGVSFQELSALPSVPDQQRPWLMDNVSTAYLQIRSRMANYIGALASSLDENAEFGNGDGRLSMSEIDAFIADQQDHIAADGDPQDMRQHAIIVAERLKFYLRIGPTPRRT